MIRINLAYFLQISTSLQPLQKLTMDLNWADGFSILHTANEQLSTLYTGSIYIAELRTSEDSAVKLLEAISTALENYADEDHEKPIGIDALLVQFAFNEFWPVFQAEIARFPAYFVKRPGAYDVITLLENADALFPDDLLTKVPEVKFDVQQAAKALAFELATSCGFHTFRVMESVLRKYYKSVTDNAAFPKQRNLGVYIQSLEKMNAGDSKILSALRQIKDLHRNPLIHPEIALEMREAISLVGVANSVISAMLKTIPPISSKNTKNID